MSSFVFMVREDFPVPRSDILYVFFLFFLSLSFFLFFSLLPSLSFLSLFLIHSFIHSFIYWLRWVFVSVQGLSLVTASGGHSSSRCAGLSLSRPLLLWSTGSRHTGSIVVAHGPSCSAACGIFPDQGSNPCPLHWQADSQPLRHQGSPLLFLPSCSFTTFFFTFNSAILLELTWCTVLGKEKSNAKIQLNNNMGGYKVPSERMTPSTLHSPPLGTGSTVQLAVDSKHRLSAWFSFSPGRKVHCCAPKTMGLKDNDVTVKTKMGSHGQTNPGSLLKILVLSNSDQLKGH